MVYACFQAHENREKYWIEGVFPAIFYIVGGAFALRCLKLDYSLSLTTKDIRKGAEAIMLRQNSTAKLTQIQREIDRMHLALQDVKGGGSYLICYNATLQTTTLHLNEQELVSIISADFGTVYFAIWLCSEAPIDKKLRDKLLLNTTKN